jgi:sporulation protein YlmC with PRC-barrel domain
MCDNQQTDGHPQRRIIASKPKEHIMLRNAEELEGYVVSATDGVIGQVNDFYLDDEKWVIRYLVVDTGDWLLSRKVLVSPIAVGTPNREQRLLPVSISREQVRNSPDIDTDKPVSRQHEMIYSGYYGYPYYWDGGGYWAGGMYPDLGFGGSIASPGVEQRESAQRETGDPHLRSCNAVIGYHIHANDGDIGHVAGMLIDEQTWAVRYLVVDTSNWWLGHKVLVAPQWIEAVNWFDRTVSVSMTRQAIKDAPIYDPEAVLSPDDEDRLHKHHGHADFVSVYPMRQGDLAQS